MPSLGTLAAGIRSVSAVRRSEVYITELGADDRPIVTDGFPQWRKFQYYPDSISDTKAVTYEPKEVPGGSLPMYQWTSSGERTISFTAVFTTDVDHLANQQTLDFDGAYIDSPGDQTLPQGTAVRESTLDGAIEAEYTRLAAAGVRDRNPFIPGMLIWLRRFLFPRYGEGGELGIPITHPPHKLLLHLPGTEIELLGGVGGFSQRGGGVLCVMTQCDVTLDALFPSGNIRAATVNLAFAEVPQAGGVVRFPSAAGMDSYLAWHRQVAVGRSGSGRSR